MQGIRHRIIVPSQPRAPKDGSSLQCFFLSQPRFEIVTAFLWQVPAQFRWELAILAGILALLNLKRSSELS